MDSGCGSAAAGYYVPIQPFLVEVLLLHLIPYKESPHDECKKDQYFGHGNFDDGICIICCSI